MGVVKVANEQGQGTQWAGCQVGGMELGGLVERVVNGVYAVLSAGKCWGGLGVSYEAQVGLDRYGGKATGGGGGTPRGVGVIETERWAYLADFERLAGVKVLGEAPAGKRAKGYAVYGCLD
jgi:hypothetical protein